MKNFKLIFLFTVVSAFNSNLVAQEKQNDATKGEAVTFLKNNIQYLNHSSGGGRRPIKLSIEDLYLYKRFENDNPGYISLNYNDIKEAKISNQAILIYAYGYVVNEKFGGVNSYNNVMRIDYLSSKKNLAGRLVKALKQIAYYNHERINKSKF